MTTTSASDGDMRCVQLATRIQRHVEFVESFFPVGIRPEEGSQGWADLATGRSPEYPWNEIEILTLHSIAGLKMTVARDHLHSMARLLHPPVSQFGPVTMARGALECCSRCYWLLDPTLSIHQRLSRAWAEQLQSAVEMNQTVRRMVPDLEDLATEAKVNEQAEVMEIGPLTKIPSATSLAGDLLRPLTLSDEGGEGIYKYWSALAHGTIYATLQRFREAGEPDSELSVRLEPHLEISTIEQLVLTIMRSHTSTVDRVMAYCGIQSSEWHRWVEDNERIMRPRFRTE